MRYFILLLLFANPVFAKPIPVLSGEHDGFTRLTLHIPRGASYQHNPTSNGVEVKITPADDGYQISDVYRRIGRERISEIASHGDVLALKIDCSCTPRIFRVVEKMLVVDIVDNEQEVDVKISPPLHISIEEPKVSQPPILPEFPELEAGLTSEIELAAGQGLLQLKESATGSAAVLPSDLEAHVGVHSHLPFEPVGPAAPPVKDRGPKPCFDKDFFRPVEFDEFGDALAEARLKWAETPGEQDGSAQEQVARLYLSAGFGIEARHLLSGIAGSKERSVLAEIGGIIDNLDSGYPMLASQVHCEGMPQLLAFLAVERLPELQDADLDGIVRTYLSLPDALKARFDGRMSEKLLALDHTQGAALVLGEKANGPPSSTEEYIARRELSERLHIEPEPVSLDEIAKSADDVIKILSAGLMQGKTPDPLLVDLAETMAYENRGTEVGERLSALFVQAKIALGDLAEAWSELESVNFDAKNQRFLEPQFFRSVTVDGRDDLFLTAAFSRSPYPFPTQLRLSIAERLAHLGFRDQAALWHPDAERNVVPGPEPETGVLAPTPQETEIEVTLTHSRELLSETSALQDRLTQLLSE